MGLYKVSTPSLVIIINIIIISGSGYEIGYIFNSCLHNI
jgi:hypothetical protein